MFNKLILEVFEKAKQELQTDVLTHLSIHIADILWEHNRFQIHERTLRNYYRKASDSSQDHELKVSPKVASFFCQYLGYSNYHSYINANSKRLKERSKSYCTKSYIIVFLTVVCLGLIFMNHYRFPKYNILSDIKQLTALSTDGLSKSRITSSIALNEEFDLEVMYFDVANQVIYAKVSNGLEIFYFVLELSDHKLLPLKSTIPLKAHKAK